MGLAAGQSDVGAGLVGLVGAVAGAAVATVGPLLLRRRLVRDDRRWAPFADDPRLALIEMLQFFVAHREDLGPHGGTVIRPLWSWLYALSDPALDEAAVRVAVATASPALRSQLAAVEDYLVRRAAVEREIHTVEPAPELAPPVSVTYDPVELFAAETESLRLDTVALAEAAERVRRL